MRLSAEGQAWRIPAVLCQHSVFNSSHMLSRQLLRISSAQRATDSPSLFFLTCNSLPAQGDEVEKLGEYVTGAGGSLGQGWTARRRLRTTGIRAGAYDTYYVSPDGEVRAL